MEKLKVTKWLFEALEKEKCNYRNEEDFKEKFLEKLYLSNRLDAVLCGYSNVYLTKCVIIGYELEDDKYDKVKKIYDFAVNQIKDSEEDKIWFSYKKGIIDTLDALGEKINGINN